MRKTWLPPYCQSWLNGINTSDLHWLQPLSVVSTTKAPQKKTPSPNEPITKTSNNNVTQNEFADLAVPVNVAFKLIIC